MITFVNPQYLYLLLALPVVAILWLLARAARRKKLRRFGNPEVIAALMPEASRYTGWIKISLALLAMAAIIIAIARPIVPNKTCEATETASARGIALMKCGVV
ncbi:MAG: BatA domain-containing protein, partial [Paramuribaculum sp.]